MNILYQFNNNYAIYAGVSIVSLFENNKEEDEIVVHILDDETDPISDDNREKLYFIAQKYERVIKIYDSNILVDLISGLQIPCYRNCYAANMRLFLDKILPCYIKKILYLDADTIIVGKINDLFETNMDDKVIAMVLECQSNPIKKDMGLKKDDFYYNSGVILYDLDKWRRNECSKKIIDHAKNIRSAYVSPDQDLLNVVFVNQIKTIDLRYNYQPFHYLYNDKLYMRTFKTNPYYSYDQLKKARNDIKIIHCYRFLGRFPWNRNSNHPNEEIWDTYLKISPWDNYKKSNCNVNPLINVEIMLKRLLPDYFYLKLFIYAQKLRIKSLDRNIKKNSEQCKIRKGREK